MARIIDKRVTAEVEGEFVVFLVGMRINRFWKIHRWLPVARAMPRMLQELSRDPESGFLGAESWFGNPTILMQYWRSFEHLEQYAKDAGRTHRPAWAAFNRALGSSGDVGIWHEAYRVRPGDFECIYNHMPPFGLGRATKLVPATEIVIPPQVECSPRSRDAAAGPQDPFRNVRGESRAKMKRPAASEYPSSYAGYLDLVPEDDVFPVLRGQIEIAREFAARVPQDRETFAYAVGKWTLREVAGHLGDGERAFSFRALCFSRADQNPLPGFEEDAYVAQSNFNETRLADLVEEFALLRSANMKMLSALRDDQWARSGIANGKTISVRALAFVMAGHVRHHFKTLRDRYAVKLDV